MKKIHYSKDIDAIIIEMNDKAIDHAEDFGDIIVHFTKDNEPVLFEIFDAKRFSLNMIESVLGEKELVIA